MQTVKSNTVPNETTTKFIKVGGAWKNEKSISIKLNEGVQLDHTSKIYMTTNGFKIDGDTKPDFVLSVRVD